MRTPSELIEYRAELYKDGDGEGIFGLYSHKSEFRKFFSDSERFSEHFSNLARNTQHAGLKIVKEEIKGKLAEVNFVEYIVEGEGMATYYTKTHLLREEEGWYILRERREQG
ncbi:hypothetical protein [Limisalsivibrio acetivorans]|uniref:hypothetical protein n=1 Tax=Limisalsivibrio acetivorans TaxID=1304888 RepID=UPI0003B4B5C8|nr:hypothetical protein [Limisalsivibrio acetivorans]